MSPTIYTHTEPSCTLIPLLKTHLPHAGPLFRRLQHNASYPSRTAHVLATFPQSRAQGSQEPLGPWVAAYADVFCGRETQVWVYSSVERESICRLATSISQTGITEQQSTFSELSSSAATIEETRAQFLALLLYIRTELVPEYLSWRELTGQTNDTTSAAAATSNFATTAMEDYASISANTSATPKRIQPHPPTSLLIGSLHTGLVAFLREWHNNPTAEGKSPRVRILRTDTPFVKYVVPRSVYGVERRGDARGADLPPGYRFQDREGREGVLEHQFDLVISRTHIPRSKESLAAMPSVAVYYDGDEAEAGNVEKEVGADETPIAWAFLGFDGSLVTLHVEPEHRGRSLAAHLGREVMRLGVSDLGVFTASEIPGDVPGDSCEDVMFADVAMDNVASRRVMEKMGGRAEWTVAWVVVEVDMNAAAG